MRIFFIILLLGFLVLVNARNFDQQMYRRHTHPDFNGGTAPDAHLQRRENCKDGGNGGPESVCGSGKDGNPKEKATNIAQKAADEAKAANEAQNAAASAAAVQVKTQLAEKAAQAAKAAEAAMAGKQVMVEQLQNEIKEAEALRQQQEQAVQNANNALQQAQQAMSAAGEQINAINVVSANAKANMQSWEAVTNNAQQELTEKTQHHELAKQRIEELLKNLAAAREDLERTKQAACKAAMAAKKAAENVGERSPRNFEKRQAWRSDAVASAGNGVGGGNNGLGYMQGRLGRRMRKRHRRPQQYLD